MLQKEKYKMKDLMVPIKRTKTCNNCRGNGYLNVIDNQNLTQVKQCWVCEIKNYDQAEVDNFIYDFYYRKRLH
jgi:excinuclease UvrABC ATPase subunit